ncbi:unnamed protein product, partial [Symbiodinium pilosum]
AVLSQLDAADDPQAEHQEKEVGSEDEASSPSSEILRSLAQKASAVEKRHELEDQDAEEDEGFPCHEAARFHFLMVPEEQAAKPIVEAEAIAEASMADCSFAASSAAEEESGDVAGEAELQSVLLEAFLNAPPEQIHGSWRGDSVSPRSRDRSAKLWRQIRAHPLPPPDPEDNYELSSQGEVFDMEEAEAELHLEHLRAAKNSPRWCENYLDMVRDQQHWDPDDVFGTSVPECNLDEILPDKLYLAQKLNRSYKKRRGSSGNWKKDHLKNEDLLDYREKMGYSKVWLLDFEALAEHALACRAGESSPQNSRNEPATSSQAAPPGFDHARDDREPGAVSPAARQGDSSPQSARSTSPQSARNEPATSSQAALPGAHDIEPTTVSRTALQGDISRRSAGSEPASSSQAAHRGAESPEHDDCASPVAPQGGKSARASEPAPASQAETATTNLGRMFESVQKWWKRDSR